MATARKRKRKPAARKASRRRTSRPKASRRGRPSRRKRAAAGPAAHAAADAAGLRVRMYRVGFGDFFLVTVPVPAGPRHILIDCGVFKGTSGTGDIGTIEEAVEDLFETTGGKLALVIMTHRHADHIAGFSRAAQRFADFTADMVWMPAWERVYDETAGSGVSYLQADVGALAHKLGMQFGGRDDPDARQALDQLWNAVGEDFSAAPKDPQALSGNALALDVLKNRLGANGTKVRYYAAGDTPELPPGCDGLGAVILGPPPLGPPPDYSTPFMRMMDLKTGVGQYLDSTDDGEDGPRAIRPFGASWETDPAAGYPARDARGFRIDYESVRRTVQGALPDMLVAASAKIDSFLNNQSLVVLFTFAGKNLLFVGDAQGGNWEHWLYRLDKPVSDTSKAGPISDASREILRTLDFYKVGHHGSTNATPIPAVEALGDDHAAHGFVAMCSTQIGTYGNPDKGTEVPRAPLMAALGERCALVRSDSFAVTTESGETIPPAAAAPLPKPTTGKLTRAKLYVDYTF